MFRSVALPENVPQLNVGLCCAHTLLRNWKFSAKRSSTRSERCFATPHFSTQGLVRLRTFCFLTNYLGPFWAQKPHTLKYILFLKKNGLFSSMHALTHCKLMIMQPSDAFVALEILMTWSRYFYLSIGPFLCFLWPAVMTSTISPLTLSVQKPSVRLSLFTFWDVIRKRPTTICCNFHIEALASCSINLTALYGQNTQSFPVVAVALEAAVFWLEFFDISHSHSPFWGISLVLSVRLHGISLLFLF